MLTVTMMVGCDKIQNETQVTTRDILYWGNQPSFLGRSRQFVFGRSSVTVSMQSAPHSIVTKGVLSGRTHRAATYNRSPF